MRAIDASISQIGIGERFRAARRRTLALCEPLTAEDMMVQSTPEASPAKWHLAHTAWFFESFILREFLPGYRPFNLEFAWLFNSYYESFAKFPEKRLRASFSRPGLDEIRRYREHVDGGVEDLLDRLLRDRPEPEALRRIELGVNHEEQHQELLLTDILHAFFTNPIRPVYLPEAERPKPESLRSPDCSNGDSLPQAHGGLAAGTAQAPRRPRLCFQKFAGGLHQVGYGDGGFCFDNEQPLHRVWLEPYELANRLVTCGEFAAFMADGGYRRPEFWLSAGWAAVQQHGWRAPLYWTQESGAWSVFTLRGEQPLDRIEDAPVSQVNYFEADAYARWAGGSLATEFEWEAAVQKSFGDRPVEGNLLDSGRLLPGPVSELVPAQGPAQLYGDCWEWTASAYLAYPGFQPLKGALGEYNGKFMSGNMVLRGGSCVTPAAHIRSTYRNFFAPETRWQFSGIRLASR